MAGADRAHHAGQGERSQKSGNELAIRVASAAVLAPLALAVAYWGGAPFTLFFGLAALLIWWEWATMSAGGARSVFLIGAAAVLAAIGFCLAGALLAAILSILAGAILVGVVASGTRRVAVAGGVLYAGAAVVAPVLLRSDPQYGFAAVIFLFALVWATDIVAYFTGRAIGGPKLAPLVSPKKTWSGAVGGAAGGAVAAAAAAFWAGVAAWPAAVLVGIGLSIAAQAGDLFESGFKRCYGAKDASRLIPGHGGVMDRLDSFIAAAVCAAIMGVLRGGLDAPARGLMIW